MLSWWWVQAAVAGTGLQPALDVLDDWGPGPIAVVAHGGQPDADGLGLRGGVVRKRLRHQGLPVDADAWVLLDGSGAVVRTHRPELPMLWAEGTAVPVERALDRARSRVPGFDPHARLSWQRVGGEMRQVWSVHFDHALPGSQWTAPIARIDGLTGLLLEVVEGAHDAGPVPMGLAYPANPILDPDPSPVPLPYAAEGLADLRMEMRQCRDLGELREISVDDVLWSLHICTEEAAAGPTNGHYIYEPVPFPEDPGRDEDAFAAPHTYWNTHRGLEWFDALGWVPLSDLDPYLEVVVNQRDTDMESEATASDPSASLAPYNNAYFTGMYETWDEQWINARMVFGQGTDADYAYDTDVILHELGHFIYKSVGGPRSYDDTPFGPASDSGAINEGLADYWSAVIQGDPALAEYAGHDNDSGVIRHLEGTATCADDQYGEVHYDGEIISQGVWAIRKTLDEATGRQFDQAVLEAISMMDNPGTMENASETLIDRVADHVDAATSAALQAELEGRGLLACDPVFDVTPNWAPFRSFHRVSGSWEYITLGPMPGPMQFRVEVPEGGQTLDLSFDQLEYLGLDLYDSAEPLPLEIVGTSADALVWSQAEVEVEIEFDMELYTFIVTEWTHDGQWLAEATEVSSRLHDDNELYQVHHYEARLELPEGTWLLQLTNPYERTATTYDLTLDVAPPPPEPAAPYSPQSSRAVPDDRAACGCDTGLPAPSGLVLLGLLLVQRRRSQHGQAI